jgi:hypothetical protein
LRHFPNKIAARDYAAVFAEGFGAFVKRGHTLGTLPPDKHTLYRNAVHLSTASYIRVFPVSMILLPYTVTDLANPSFEHVKTDPVKCLNECLAPLRYPRVDPRFTSISETVISSSKKISGLTPTAV